jgi:hypothetical protein
MKDSLLTYINCLTLVLTYGSLVDRLDVIKSFIRLINRTETFITNLLERDTFVLLLVKK